MEKSSVKVGVSRKNGTEDVKTNKTNMFLFVLGALLICTSLIIPMIRRSPDTLHDSVAVISDAVYESESDSSEIKRENLVPHDRPASAEDDFSIFEYIGEAISSLLTGVK